MILSRLPQYGCIKREMSFLKRCNRSRYFSTKSSSDIRNGFINYFVNEHDHKFIKSSPVVPFCDPTVAFVNAGMNQFKGVFLGQFSPPFPRVVNSQKCVRVGGKHNDLDIVGTDGYHHTFFEMLGNWSFGDYYKLEACQMAWTLLTKDFGMDPNRLTVTYFGGDKEMNLNADLECKDIWRSVGVSENNLIPGSAVDNFWEMGPVGPCGPCTELHYRQDDGSLMEIWNIVFIQFNRQADGSIQSLPKCHVDTGMGLERMAALLQNKSSNYDTDLFLPIIQTIQKESGNNVLPYRGKYGADDQLDIAYRTLADHSRMISICLADGVFPSRNLRLRNVLRKSISLSNHVFQCPSGMISTLYDQVAVLLGDAYPELRQREREAKQIIKHEEELLVKLEKNITKQKAELFKLYPEVRHLKMEFSAGFADGYKHFKQAMKKLNANSIPGSLAFKLYDTFGIREDMIEQIAQWNNLGVDMDSFQEHLEVHKTKHKAVINETASRDLNLKLNMEIDKLVNEKQIKTDDSYKYNYSFNQGVLCIPNVTSTLLAMFTNNGEPVDVLNVDYENQYHLIFDQTNFYCEEGGQSDDVGEIKINDLTFNVKSVKMLNGLVLHSGNFTKSADAPCKLEVGAVGELIVSGDDRLHIMQHHTATHLLNAALKSVLPMSVTCQLSSKVTSSGLVFELGVYGEKLTTKTLMDAQDLVRMACSRAVPVKVSEINVQQLLSLGDVITVPGEVYPETGMRLVEVDLMGSDNVFSRELCCGTHVPSTDLIEDFAITAIRGTGSHAPIIRAVAGNLAKEVHKLANDARLLFKELEYNDVADKAELQEQINKLRNSLNDICKGDGVAFGIRAECMSTLDSVEKKMRNKDTKSLVDLVKSEMSVISVEQSEKPYIVHFLICSYLLEPSNLSLYAAVECVMDKPILILGCACGIIKATCHVPKNFVTSNFTAKKWMESIIPTFETNIVPPVKNQDIDVLAHMSGKKVSLTNCESLVADAIKRATAFANQHLHLTNEKKTENKEWSSKTDTTKVRGQNT